MPVTLVMVASGIHAMKLVVASIRNTCPARLVMVKENMPLGWRAELLEKITPGIERLRATVPVAPL